MLAINQAGNIVINMEDAKKQLIAKYGETFIVYANLWELEAELTSEEQNVAWAIREDSIKAIR